MSTNIKPDKEQAQLFLNCLAPNADTFTFQTFQDSKSGEKKPLLARVLTGTLLHHWPTLVSLNQNGAGIFVTVNETDGYGRKKDNVTRIRAVWQEADKGDEPDLPITPHIVVQSSPGKYHRYILTDTDRVDEFEPVQQCLVDTYGSDPNAKDRSRVLRLPGFFHLKTDPHMVRIVECSDEDPIAWRKLKTLLPPVDRPQSRSKPISTTDDGNDIEEIRSALEAIDPCGCDYHQWLSIGMALWSTNAPEAFNLWNEWSNDDIERYKADEMKSKWASFHEVKNGIKIGTLFHMAKEAGWSRGSSITFKTIEESIDTANELALNDVTAILKRLANSDANTLEVSAAIKKLSSRCDFGVRELTSQFKEFNAQNSDLEPETHQDVAMLLIQHFTEEDRVPPIATEGDIYRYSDGLWSPTSLPKLETIIAAIFNKSKACRRKNDYRQISQHAYDILEDSDFFNAAPVGIATADGFFSIDSYGEIKCEDMGPDHRLRFAFKTDPKKGSIPRFHKHMKRCFAGDVKASINLLQEIFGSVVFGILPKKHRAVMFLGPGRTGKSTTLNILSSLIDRRHQSATTPYKWDSEYYVAAMAGKALNMVGELAEDKPIPAADFKRVTGGDVLQGRHPTHRPFEFVNTASHVFNTNHLPYTKDRSDAFFSRWIILEFKNPIPENERIDGFEESILENELSQIMQWAMEGAQRVTRTGRFTQPNSHIAQMKKWQVQTSTVIECLLDEDIFHIGTNEEMKRSEFYPEYTHWCSLNGRRSMGRNKALDELQSAEVNRHTGIKVQRDKTGEWIIKGVRRITYLR